MKNVIILGSGRSGTSMVAGTLSQSGYFMGDRLLPPNDANPKGFFEDMEVNAINEDILESVAPKRPWLLGNLFFRHIPLHFQRWLLSLPIGQTLTTTPDVENRIIKIVANAPYCFKDPRFSYTLSNWQPYLDNCCYIVVFREPIATAISINKECNDDPRLHSLAMNIPRALEVWKSMYRHIIGLANNDKEWLFIHYNQVLNQEGLKHISEHTGAKVDLSFPEKSLKRSMSDDIPPELIQRVYLDLCKRAGYIYESSDRHKRRINGYNRRSYSRMP